MGARVTRSRTPRVSTRGRARRVEKQLENGVASREEEAPVHRA